MATPVEEVRAMLDRLEPETSFEAIAYHVGVLAKIAAAEKAADRGEFVSEDEIMRRVEACLSQSGSADRPRTTSPVSSTT